MTDTMKKLHDHSKAVKEAYPDYRVVSVMLYGAQNYKMETPESDVDTKVMVLPPKRDLLLGKKMLSAEVKLPDGSLANVKDARLMVDNFFKSNPNFLECLVTQYYLVSPRCEQFYLDLRQYADAFAFRDRWLTVRAAYGMACQEYDYMSHPYSGEMDVLEKYGYDPKRLHHLARLYELMKTVAYDKKHFEDMLVPADPQDLLKLKTTPLDYCNARELADALHSKMVDFYDHFTDQTCNPEYKDYVENNTRKLRASMDALLYKLLHSYVCE